MSLLFNNEVSDENELTNLVMQWLDEKGYSNALKSLEEDSGHQYHSSTVKMGGQLEVIFTDYKELQLSMQSANNNTDDDDNELKVEGNGVYPKTLCKVFDKVHAANILSFRFHTNETSNLMVTSSSDRTIRVTNYITGEHLNTFYGNSHFLSLDFNPVNPEFLLASAVDGKTLLFKLTSDGKVFEVLQEFNTHKKYVVRVRWSNDGQLFATCSYDKTVCVYGKDGDTYKLKHTWEVANTVESLIFTPSGDNIIAAIRESNYLHYFNIEDHSIEKYNMNSNGDDHVSFSAMEFSIPPQSNYLVVSTDRSRLIMFKLYSDKQVRNFYGATNDQYCTTRNRMDPTGKYLYSTSQDNVIYVWEISSQKVVAKLSGHRNSIRDIDIAPNGEILGSVSFDKTVILWTNDGVEGNLY
ncbi:hypothetical protein DLAC_07975 [Tieghemostelium lacteum]|uniref:WD40 repeat-containing protein n=1 Tax=Tieghemostelium lacteum TaxID=361077 RepID=A0A151ZAT8_TIELA|nr:hypothetical protein DLAC_07975 [Tieghemostelium lacteum]|eukprot:KYQ91072.1 hypothetical protein DLAC_07975 [Tieghemostelium lacteum]